MTNVATPTSRERAPLGRPRFIDTESLVFWVFAVAAVFSALHIYSYIASNPLLQGGIAWVAVVEWLAYGGIFLAIVYHHQLFVRRPASTTFAALAWGGLVALWFAIQANQALQDILAQLFSTEWSSKWGLSVTAATNEETLKTLGLVVLVLLPLIRVRSVLDGWFYGMMIGLGFQVVEDYMYTVSESGSIGDALNFMVTRGLLAGLWAHAVYTGIVGAGVGFLVTRRDRTMFARISAAVLCFVFAWLMHWFWDSPLLEDWGSTSTGAFFVAVLVKGLPALAVLLLVMRWGRRHERVVWAEFVEHSVDPTLVSDADRTALLDRRGRRAARKQARRAGGRHAEHVQKQLQYVQLRYVQAALEDGLGSERAVQLAGDIRDLQRLAVAGSALAEAGG